MGVFERSRLHPLLEIAQTGLVFGAALMRVAKGRPLGVDPRRRSLSYPTWPPRRRSTPRRIARACSSSRSRAWRSARWPGSSVARSIVLDRADALRDALVAWSHAAPWIGWLVPVGLAAAAAFVARWLVRRFAPEASGSGVQHVEAVIRGDARVTGAAVLPVKFFGGALALGAGLALGREGPTVQMSATLGHLATRWFRLGAADARVLLAAGAGAGLAAAFNAPLAGAVFVFEELVRRFELRVAVATLAACSAGLAVMRALVGDRLVFSVPAIEVDLFPGYLLFLVFGGLIGLLGSRTTA